MRVSTSKSKNAESFYITKGYVNDRGVSTSVIVRKLGTLKDLLPEHGPTRDDVMAWAKEQARIETQKYKKGQESRAVPVTFRSDRRLDRDRQVFYRGGYLFPLSVYYLLQLKNTCRKMKARRGYPFDLNAILSDLVCARVLEPDGSRSSFQAASEFLEKPAYDMKDISPALDVLGEECDFIQSEVYLNSRFLGQRNDSVIYCDCMNFYFESEPGGKSGKGKTRRTDPVIQMRLFLDADGIPLAFSLFPGSSDGQAPLNSLEEKVLQESGCGKLIWCCDAGFGSGDVRVFEHKGKEASIVTQSLRKMPADDRAWALSKKGFRRVSDNRPVDITQLPPDDDQLYYKEKSCGTDPGRRRLVVTYSPRFAAHQKDVRARQIERAEELLSGGEVKRQRHDPDDPARFLRKKTETENGKAVKVRYCLDQKAIAAEAKYDGFNAVSTDLADDNVGDILKVSEGRREIWECFRVMKTDFSASPDGPKVESRVRAHFLTCFLALLFYRTLEKNMKDRYTDEEILTALRSINFAEVQEQGFIPLYRRSEITDALHEACGFRTDYQFISKSRMKAIQKESRM